MTSVIDLMATNLRSHQINTWGEDLSSENFFLTRILKKKKLTCIHHNGINEILYVQSKFHKCKNLYFARSHKSNTMGPAALNFIQAFS